MALAAVFAVAAVRYWLTIFPRTVAQTHRLRRRASLIADAAIRDLALTALRKRGNIEGSAAFAALAGSKRRAALVRALVTFQALYNHLDLLAEQRSVDAVADGRRLHEALLDALDVERSGTRFLGTEDGGYVAELIETCSSALRRLPSYPLVADAARAAAGRIVTFQSLSLGDVDTLERWTVTQTQEPNELLWWETAAAAGSSLAVCALISGAAAPSLDGEGVAAIQSAYFPCVGALHSLLDSLVDVEEDAQSGHLSLVGCYRSRIEVATRLRLLTAHSLAAVRNLASGRGQVLLVAAMACNYLAAKEASQPRAITIAAGVREELGGWAAPILLIFRIRHLGGIAAAAPRRASQSCGAKVRAVASVIAKRRPGADAGAA